MLAGLKWRPREPMVVVALLICGALERLVVPSNLTKPYLFPDATSNPFPQCREGSRSKLN